MGEPTAYVTSGSQDRDGGGGVGDSDVPEEMEQETRSEPATNSLEMTLPFIWYRTCRFWWTRQMPLSIRCLNSAGAYLARSTRALYTRLRDSGRTAGVPPPGTLPLRFWIIPTTTTSFTGSIQNQVPNAPPQ